MRRRNLKELRLTHISAVDRPCQEGAKAMIIKAAPDPKPEDDDEMKRRKTELEGCMKWVGPDDGAHSFNEVLAENRFAEKIWPCVDAFTQSIRSIVGDSSLSGGERDAEIEKSVAQFLSAVRAIDPEVSKQLEKLLAKKESPMPKTIEEFQAELNKVNGELTSANALVTAEKVRADKAEGELATAKQAQQTAEDALAAAKKEGGDLATVKAELESEKAAHAETKKQLVAATDEEITVGGETIKRSEVGNASFNIAKGLRDERDTARLEKRASDEFGHVVGTDAEKALILKSVDSRPDEDPTKKAILAVMTAAEKMAKAGFQNFGRSDEPSETQKAASQKFDAKVEELVKGGMGRAAAMSKARQDNPELFAEVQGNAG